MSGTPKSKNADLTSPMRHALAFARDHDGRILRFPGGFWGTNGHGAFGTTTIEALVSRGLLTYSGWHEGGGRRFPIEATLVVDAELVARPAPEPPAQ